jgi:tRNA dimethylallyltransferase
VVALVGPTGVGKTTASLGIARRLKAEIVSCDSRLLYRGMDIGTAKPTAPERAEVPHHLIDVADPRQPWSLAVYRREALRAIGEIHGRGRLPLLVGGTGQYFSALLDGWLPPPVPPNPMLREGLQHMAAEEGVVSLWDRLREIDPDSAARIDPRNVRRVIRALEIYQMTGIAPSRQRVRSAPSFDTLRIGLTMPRQELYARIDRRLDRMLDEGLLDEVRRLLEAGVEPDSPAMSAIGYRQLAAHLRGEMSLEEAVQGIRKATRVFVRRQANWFKAEDPHIVWFDAEEGVEPLIASYVSKWLDSPPGNQAIG